MGSLISSFSKKPGGLERFWSLIPHLSILPFVRRAGIRGGVHCPRLLKGALFVLLVLCCSHAPSQEHPTLSKSNTQGSSCRKSTGQESVAPCTGCSHLELSKPASRQPDAECNIPAVMPR